MKRIPLGSRAGGPRLEAPFSQGKLCQYQPLCRIALTSIYRMYQATLQKK